MRAHGFLLLAVCAACSSSDPDEAAQLGHYDGMWNVTAISGQPVPEGAFLLRVRGGRVSGGRDGCNAWGFDATRPPAADGTRMIISDAQECSPTPQLRGYWRALGNGNAPLRRTGSGELRIRAGGDEIIARRIADQAR